MRLKLPFLVVCLLASTSIGAEPDHRSQPAIAVYRWANGAANVDAFADWLGRDLVWGEDFAGSESWSNVAWPVWWLEAWSE